MALAVVLGVGAFVAQPFRVAGSSMEPFLHDGDRVVIVKPGRREARRFDVVVVTAPGGRSLVKRIIGLPGERIGVRAGVVTVNGQPLAERHRTPPDAEDHLDEIALREGEVFVVGDNRPHSVDSREHGPVPLDAVRGRVALRYWPPARVGRMPRE